MTIEWRVGVVGRPYAPSEAARKLPSSGKPERWVCFVIRLCLLISVLTLKYLYFISLEMFITDGQFILLLLVVILANP